MRSQLAKVGWNFEAGQRLEFSYLQTQIASPNASMLSEVLALSPSGKEITKIGWRNTSFTNVENRNIALDYRLNPEHISWLDATARSITLIPMMKLIMLIPFSRNISGLKHA